jgi:predicted O-methyltransferase YrrM
MLWFFSISVISGKNCFLGKATKRPEQRELRNRSAQRRSRYDCDAMDPDLWTSFDNYVENLLIPRDPVLEAALKTSDAAGLPPIQVSPALGKLLHLLARAQGARKILEIGTLAGYSTIWMARALPPEGKLITLEVDPTHAEVARANFVRAGLASVVELRLGPALETLPALLSEGKGPFDMVFIDADKTSYADYLGWALRLTRRGSLIIADNVVRDGEVANLSSTDVLVQGVRRFNELLAADPRVSATVVQTVGSKGYDGFALAVVVA